MKTALRLFSGILAALPPFGQAAEEKKDGKLMKHIYSQITAEWVGVWGAVALALCSDRLQSIRPTAPFTNMQQTTITDP